MIAMPPKMINPILLLLLMSELMTIAASPPRTRAQEKLEESSSPQRTPLVIGASEGIQESFSSLAVSRTEGTSNGTRETEGTSNATGETEGTKNGTRTTTNATSKERKGFHRSLEMKEERQRVFGRRPYGPLSRFKMPLNQEQKWVGYFFEESLAVVLQSSSNLMTECTVIELRKDKEQQVGHQTFGSLMPLVPLALADMIHLMRLCNELPSNQIPPRARSNLPSNEDAKGQGSAFILPGTLWCGIKDRAERFENIGEKANLDSCCRAHDHCPLKMESFEKRYGVTNFGIGTRSHCLCEDEFYRCLKNLNDPSADMMGNFYFNVLQAKCLQGPAVNSSVFGISQDVQPEVKLSTNPSDSLYECQKRDIDGYCRLWNKRMVHYALKLNQFDKKF